MNIPFRINKGEDLENKFIVEAEEQGIYEMKGHPYTGGLRASIYNAMPVGGVKKLVDFMNKFREENQ